MSNRRVRAKNVYRDAATHRLAAFVALAVGSIVTLTAVAAQPANSASAAAVDKLWIDPTDLERRDLFRGPALGPEPPQKQARFVFVENDTTGRSPGYDVRDGGGVLWSVKLGPEAQSEVVSSRILWAMGFHQPPTYHLKEWKLTGVPVDQSVSKDTELGGRFRPEVPGWKVVEDRWEWNNNPT
jgi:hypothetical protein